MSIKRIMAVLEVLDRYNYTVIENNLNTIDTLYQKIFEPKKEVVSKVDVGPLPLIFELPNNICIFVHLNLQFKPWHIY